jgi:hypothetical protein
MTDVTGCCDGTTLVARGDGAPIIGVRRNPGDYLPLRSSMHARLIRQREEREMFIFHDLVDLFALFGLVHLGRGLMQRRHKVS